MGKLGREPSATQVRLYIYRIWGTGRFEKCSQSIRIRCNNQVTHAFVASIIVRHFEAIGEEFRLQEANGYRLAEDGTRIYPRSAVRANSYFRIASRKVR